MKIGNPAKLSCQKAAWSLNYTLKLELRPHPLLLKKSCNFYKTKNLLRALSTECARRAIYDAQICIFIHFIKKARGVSSPQGIVCRSQVWRWWSELLQGGSWWCSENEVLHFFSKQFEPVMMGVWCWGKVRRCFFLREDAQTFYGFRF